MANPLDADECVYLEIAQGDKGLHTAQPWWLSPDVFISAPNPPDAQAGVLNTLSIRVHRSATCAAPDPDERTICEAFIGHPNTAITPHNARFIGRVKPFTTALTEQGQIFKLSFRPADDLAAANGPGHRCIVVQCYPESLQPSPDFFFSGRHTVQRNIFIVKAIPAPPASGAPAADEVLPDEEGLFPFPLETPNPEPTEPEVVVVESSVDLEPPEVVVETVTPLVTKVPGFKKVVTAKPPPHQLKTLAAFREVRDLTGGPDPRRPSYEVDLDMAPKEVANLTLQADLSDLSAGDARIYHVRQMDKERNDHGGLTVVYVMTR